MDVLDRLRVSASPAIATVNGTSMVFLGAWNGNFYALNAVTGKKIWSFTVDLVPPCKTNSCRIASSAAVDTANNPALVVMTVARRHQAVAKYKLGQRAGYKWSAC
jgi:outer membrane protein assembly factor BamB